jgi:hypothetical protein
MREIVSLGHPENMYTVFFFWNYVSFTGFSILRASLKEAIKKENPVKYGSHPD